MFEFLIPYLDKYKNEIEYSFFEFVKERNDTCIGFRIYDSKFDFISFDPIFNRNNREYSNTIMIIQDEKFTYFGICDYTILVKSLKRKIYLIELINKADESI